MTYTARHNDVEAAFVSLAGASLAVVAIDGKAHAMPADVFLSLYEERQAPPEPETPRRREEKQQVAKANAPKRSGGGRPSPTQDKLYDILARFGPLTTAEVGTHAYPEQRDGAKASGAASAVLQDMRRVGRVMRIEHNGLDKWQAVPQP